MNLTADQIRSKFLQFFESKGHKIIPSASLIPENDPSVLFNTAGMQPLMPYLLGQTHPMGTRIAGVQKCVRTVDIDEVGDNRHCTFFEMLGNWSLGDYFKEEAIAWSFEFLTNKETGLGLDMNRIYVTVFEGDENAERDNEAADIWKKYLPEGRIYFLPAKNNWWSAGENSPCGPDTEIFYDTNDVALGDMSHDEFVKADDEGKVIEIWNNVFMVYEKKDGKVIGKLAQHNVDTGMGLERIVMVCQGVKTVFDTDLFNSIISEIEELSELEYGNKTDEEYIKKGEQCFVDTRKMMRIVSDHLRTSVFIIADGGSPSNTGSGYILRRILRRVVRFSDKLGLKDGSISQIVDVIIKKYKKAYPDLDINKNKIKQEINKEESKFRQTLENGLKKFIRIKTLSGNPIKNVKSVNGNPISNIKSINGVLVGNKISGEDAFDLYQSYGFPIELTIEEAKTRGMEVDIEEFNSKMKEHQKLSQTSSAGMFKGGLADSGEESIKYHTATHLLLASLRQILGGDITQKGSNITAERMRFDFNWPEKLTAEQLKSIEDLVNQKITEAIPVEMQELQKEEAVKVVKNISFDLAKYGDIVKVYKIGDFSIEFCGGPHVSNTSDLAANPGGTPKHFKITKEEASSQGIRRIKAVLE